MPLQARRCHVALSRFRGPCGRVSEEAAGADVMAVSMARAVMDLRGCTCCSLGSPDVRQSVYFSLYGRHTFSPNVDVSLFVVPVCLSLRPHNVLSSDRNHLRPRHVASGPRHSLLRCGDERKLSMISLASFIQFIATALLIGSIHPLPTLVAERAFPSDP